MKEYYTAIEKNILKYLNDHSCKKLFVNELIVEHMDAVAIELINNNLFEIFTTEDVSHKEDMEYSKAEKSILDIICFVDYLLKNNLIYTFRYTDDIIDTNSKIYRIYNKKQYEYVEKTKDHKQYTITSDNFESISLAQMLPGNYISKCGNIQAIEVKSRIISQGYISKFLKSHIGEFVYVSPILTEVVKNDFKTNEQIRFRKQLKEAINQTKGAYIAAFVSFLGLLVALVLPFCTKMELAEKDEIIKAINATKIAIPADIDTKITNDTIKVDVANKVISTKTQENL